MSVATFRGDRIRDLDRESIRAFVQSAADDGYLSGRVLDYGCGLSPYHEIVVSAGGDYWGHDSYDYPANVPALEGSVYFANWEPLAVKRWSQRWQAILCTQVVQYVPDVPGLLARFYKAMRKGDSALVLTYPTTWPEVEREDLHRFTKAGMERLLTETGFEIVRHERRASFHGPGGFEEFALGYGVIARA